MEQTTKRAGNNDGKQTSPKHDLTEREKRSASQKRDQNKRSPSKMPTPTKRPEQSAVESRSSCKCEVDGDVCDCTRPCSLDLSIDQRSYTDDRAPSHLTKEEILANALSSVKQKLGSQTDSPRRRSCKCETDGELCNCTRPCSLEWSTRSNSLDDRKGSLMQGDPNKSTQDRKPTAPGLSQGKGYTSVSRSKYCKECGKTENFCRCSKFCYDDSSDESSRDPATSSKLNKRPNAFLSHCPCESDGDDVCSCDGCSLAGYSASPNSPKSPDSHEKEFYCCSKRNSSKSGTTSQRPSAEEPYYSGTGRKGSAFDHKTSPKYEKKYNAPSKEAHSVGEIYNDTHISSKQTPMQEKIYHGTDTAEKSVSIPGKSFHDRDIAERPVSIPGKSYHDTETAEKLGKSYHDTDTELKPGKLYHDTDTEQKPVPVSGKSYHDTDTELKPGKSYHDSDTEQKSGKSYHDSDIELKPGKSYHDTDTELKPGKSYHDSDTEQKSGKSYHDTDTDQKPVPVPGKSYCDSDTEQKSVPIPGKSYHDTDTEQKPVPVSGKLYQDTDTELKPGNSYYDPSTAEKPGKLCQDTETAEKPVSIPGKLIHDTDTAQKPGKSYHDTETAEKPGKSYHDSDTSEKQVRSVREIYSDRPTTSKQVPIQEETYDTSTSVQHVRSLAEIYNEPATTSKHVPIKEEIYDTNTSAKHVRSLGEIYNETATTSKHVPIKGDTDTAAKDGKQQSADKLSSTPRVVISSTNVDPDVPKRTSQPENRNSFKKTGSCDANGDKTGPARRRLKSVSFPKNEEHPGTSRLGESSKTSLGATSIPYISTTGCTHVDKSSPFRDKGRKERAPSPEESIIIDVELMPGLLTGSKPSAESLQKKEQENRKGGKK